jgi:hypothetical protein
MIEVPLEKIMPELVADTESLEPLVWYVGRINNAENVVVSEQHS